MKNTDDGLHELLEKIIDDIPGLNKKIDRAVYVLIIDGIMIASTRKSDINEFLRREKTLVIELTDNKGLLSLDANEIVLIYGLVLNPLELPMELPDSLKNYDVWIIKEKVRAQVEYSKCADIEEAVGEIEEYLEAEQLLEIEDFAVLVGIDVDLILQAEPNVGTISAVKELF
jgi:hypothetical protein